MTAYLSLASPILKGVMVCLVAGLSLSYGASKVSGWRLSQWRLYPTMPPIPQTIASLDPGVSLKVLDGIVLTLVLLGGALVGFETACLRCRQRLSGWILDTPQAARNFWRRKVKSKS